MKKIIVSICLLMATCSVIAQKDTTDEIGDKEFKVVQIGAEFPGGSQGWMRYIQTHLNTELGGKYVKIPRRQSMGKATVVVSFIVDKDGNVAEAVAEQTEEEVHPKLIKEAIRVIMASPKWTPAEQDGKKVKYRQRQSITFVANKE